MRPIVRLVALTALAVGLLAPALASSQPLRIHDPFHEGGRFTTKNLRLAGQGNTLIVERGGRIAATLDLNHHCPSCGAAQNQVIVGLAGEPAAQACVFNGGSRPTGWTTVRFELDVPDVPGVYEVRARYAQARSCRDAAGWWRTDRPSGPGGQSTIGVVVVEGTPLPPERTTREILPDLRRVAARLAEAHERLVDATRGRRINQGRVADLAERAATLGAELASLHEELEDALRRGDRVERRDPRPRFARPEFVVVAEPVGPEPMTPQAFDTLLRRIDQATFPNAQLQTLDDHLAAGAFFLTSQAVRVLGKFPHETHKVEAAVKLCPYIVEPGALPDLLAAFTFNSYKDELRQKTRGVCGWTP